MKKVLKDRNTIIMILCVTIICMAIGFMVLSVKFKNEKDAPRQFDVSFLTIKNTSSVKGSLKDPTAVTTITNSGKEIDMHVVMYSIHDELSYVAKIKNNGTLKAEIVDIFTSPSYEKEPFSKSIFPVTIKMSDVKGKIIPPGEEMDLKIVFYYPSTTQPITPKEFDYKIALLTKSR